MPFRPGVSGNPNGRPPKRRALTEILDKAGSAKVTTGDGLVARKQVLANLLWQVATTGEATMPDGKRLKVSPRDWLDIVRFIYRHIDGPPPSETSIEANGQPVGKVVVEFVNYYDEDGSDSGDDSAT